MATSFLVVSLLCIDNPHQSPLQGGLPPFGLSARRLIVRRPKASIELLCPFRLRISLPPAADVS